MTNEQIILSNRVFLMEEGVIGGTGEKFVYKDEKGEREIEIPEEIHTFQGWKELGRIVKKGEHSVARFPIWQKSKKKRTQTASGTANAVQSSEAQHLDQEADGSEVEGVYAGRGFYFYRQVAFFFTKSQTEAIS